jgi:hypothetical protein
MSQPLSVVVHSEYSIGLPFIRFALYTTDWTIHWILDERDKRTNNNITDDMEIFPKRLKLYKTTEFPKIKWNVVNVMYILGDYFYATDGYQSFKASAGENVRNIRLIYLGKTMYNETREVHVTEICGQKPIGDEEKHIAGIETQIKTDRASYPARTLIVRAPCSLYGAQVRGLITDIFTAARVERKIDVRGIHNRTGIHIRDLVQFLIHLSTAEPDIVKERGSAGIGNVDVMHVGNDSSSVNLYYIARECKPIYNAEVRFQYLGDDIRRYGLNTTEAFRWGFKASLGIGDFLRQQREIASMRATLDDL